MLTLQKMKMLSQGKPGQSTLSKSPESNNEPSTKTTRLKHNTNVGSTGVKKFGGTQTSNKYLANISAADTTPKPTKRKPASSSAEKTTQPMNNHEPHAAPTTTAQKGKPALASPGEQKRKPLTYGKSVVYFSPGRYRLMKTKGDRVDIAFSHKTTGARVAWRNLCIGLRKLNPDV